MPITADLSDYLELLGSIGDVDTSGFADGYVLTYSTATGLWEAAAPPGAGGGEANTLTSVGAGASLYKTKVGVDLRIRSIVGGTGISASQNTDDVTIDVSGLTEADITDYDPAATDMARVAGSTYSTIQHAQDIFHSTGVTTGGGITDDGDGTITVAAGTGLIRATDSVVAPILWTDWAAEAGANVALTDNDQNYIYVEYNAGAPRVIATITKRTDTNANVPLGTVYRSGTTLSITATTQPLVGDHALRMIQRLLAVVPFARESGGIIGETGTRNVTVTAGVWWNGLNQFSTAAIDTSGADTFTACYQDGVGGWTTQTAQSAINNSDYDDTTGTLEPLVAQRYGVHWVYLSGDGDLYTVYGLGSYTLAQAEAAGVPANTPPWFADLYARLIGKIIIQASASTFTAILSAFSTTLSAATPTDHGDLSGLADDDHAQYVLADGSRQITGSQDFAASTALTWNTTAILSDASGTMTLGNIDSIDATTEATIEAAIDALSGVTITSLTTDGAIVEETYAWTSTTGAVTTELDPANGTIQRVTLTGNITSLTDNVAAGESITLGIDDGTARTITWPTITWVNNAGAAPTLATSGYTWVAIWKVSTTLYGALVGDGT